MMKVFIRVCGEFGEHFQHLAGKGTRRHDAILGALQLRRRDHLHRFGDLLRVLDRLDAAPDIEKVSHN
jgi:hypothetical protein